MAHNERVKGVLWTNPHVQPRCRRRASENLGLGTQREGCPIGMRKIEDNGRRARKHTRKEIIGWLRHFTCTWSGCIYYYLYFLFTLSVASGEVLSIWKYPVPAQQLERIDFISFLRRDDAHARQRCCTFAPLTRENRYVGDASSSSSSPPTRTVVVVVVRTRQQQQQRDKRNTKTRSQVMPRELGMRRTWRLCSMSRRPGGPGPERARRS